MVEVETFGSNPQSIKMDTVCARESQFVALSSSSYASFNFDAAKYRARDGH